MTIKENNDEEEGKAPEEGVEQPLEKKEDEEEKGDVENQVKEKAGDKNDDDDGKDKDKDEGHEETKINAPSKKTTAAAAAGGGGTANYPDVFYCPITKKLLTDPVVIPDGVTYERTAIVERGDIPADKLYSNRALADIIEERELMSGTSVASSMHRLKSSLRQSMKQIMEKTPIPTEEYRPLPDAFYCPITFNIMFDPVIDPEGNTYERVAIEDWITVNGMSPVTRTTLAADSLYPNTAIKTLLDDEKKKEESQMHPSIRKWKSEDPPERKLLADNNAGTGDGGTTANAFQFPTTESELEARRQERIRAAYGCVALLFLIVLFVFASMYGGFWIIFCITLYCICRKGREE